MPAASAERPLAIISTQGLAVLSASLVSPQSQLRRMSLLARNPHIRVHTASDDDDDTRSQAGRGSASKAAVAPAAIEPSALLVASTAGGRHKEDVRRALETHPEARCLVEFCADGHPPCIMTLYEDGFVWNQEVFLDRRSRDFETVARQNPFMHCVRSPAVADADADADGSDSDGGSGSTMVQVYATTVHEIREEDCPRLFA
ncbi:hypothetical protein H4R19_005494 [Coemansia spiralis]|nr:hypothetical protein H4R19_005494 [Coemansia spiralis]